MIRILFVCLGNICRSPMAEAIFRDLLKNAALSDKIKVDSAGLGHWHVGQTPHEGTRDILAKQAIAFNDIYARQISKRDFQTFDYVIAMDKHNRRALEDFERPTHRAEVARLMDYVNDAVERDVPDPYITGDFAYTYSLVSKGCLQLFHTIRTDHNL